eukprot:1124273-Rhodomonas_salina.2
MPLVGTTRGYPGTRVQVPGTGTPRYPGTRVPAVSVGVPSSALNCMLRASPEHPDETLPGWAPTVGVSGIGFEVRFEVRHE